MGQPLRPSNLYDLAVDVDDPATRLLIDIRLRLVAAQLASDPTLSDHFIAKRATYLTPYVLTGSPPPAQ